MTVSFNLDRPTLKDVRVRRAIALALDRDAFLRQVLFNEGKVATAPISSEILWAHAARADSAIIRSGRSRAASRGDRLEERSGMRRGSRAVSPVSPTGLGSRSTSCTSPPSPSMVSSCGSSSVPLASTSPSVRSSRPCSRPPSSRTVTFDTNVISYCNGPDPEIGVRRMYHSSQIGPAPFTNAAGYRNERVDALFDRRRPDRGARTPERALPSDPGDPRAGAAVLSGWWRRPPRAPGRRGAAASRRGQGSSRRRPPVSDRPR